MTISIAGLGTATPASRMSQADAFVAAEQLCCDSDEQRRVMGLIYEGTGVRARSNVLLEATTGVANPQEHFFRKRIDDDDRGPTTSARMRKYEEYSLDLALESCRAALHRANEDVSSITHLVTVSCTGASSPGIDLGLIQNLQMSWETSRTHIGFMGCHGSFNAMRVAKAFIESDPEAVVLVCSVELCSLHHHYGWSTEKVTANALFGDGSAAAVCRSAVNDHVSIPAPFQLHKNGTALIAGTSKAMSWRIGDHGFEMTLSRRVPSLIKQNIEPWVKSFLAKEGLLIEDVKTWAIHGLGPCILDGFAKALSLEDDQVAISRAILAEYGNMSSATILFLLERIQEESQHGPVVALGFGPGLTIEGMILNTQC